MATDTADADPIVLRAPPPGGRQSDHAFERIKQEIILCRLAPGMRFSEGQLSERLGLGRAAARAALIRLADLGLVDPVARHGFIVSPISLNSVRDLFELRLILEPKVAALAVGKVDPARLRAINRDPQLARTGEDRLAFVDSNRLFHGAIARATGNLRIVHLLDSISDEMQRLVQFGLFGPKDIDGIDADREAADGHHRALIAAFESLDQAAAEHAAWTHVEHARDLVMRRLVEHRAPLA